MMPWLNHSFFKAFAASLLLAFGCGVRAAEVKDSLEVVGKTNRSAVESQKKIDAFARDTQSMLEEYRKLQDGTEYQAAYTRELEELQLAQQQQIDELREQIAQARITRQRIVPLMRSMADALETFVVLDLPFQHEDRINAVLQLKQRLNQPDLSVSAKFRLLLEAYQIEQGYGGSIEACAGHCNLAGRICRSSSCVWVEWHCIFTVLTVKPVATGTPGRMPGSHWMLTSIGPWRRPCGWPKT